MRMEKKVPEIRFKEFSREWENKKIGRVLTEIKRPIELMDNTSYQLVTVKRRNEGIIPRAVLKGKNILVKNYFSVEAGDYLISKRQVVHGANGIVPDNLDGAVVSNEYLVVTDSDDITARYWTVISIRPEMHKLFFISSYGVDIEKLVFDVTDWKNRTIFIPQVTEQKNITDYFQKLDSLIAQHQKKHEKLSSIKKAMLEKMFPKQGETIPEIRFKGFIEEWEKKPFGACFVNVPNNTLSRADLNYKNGFAKNIHYGDILVKFGEVLDARNEVLPFITNDGVANKLKNAALRDGDIVIADAAEDSTVGKCTELFNIGEQIVLSGLHTIAVRPIFSFASKYIGYHLNSSSYHDQLLSLMQGTKVLSISKTAIQNTDITFPKSVKEQAAIGNYFQKLDAMINQHQQQITKLNNIKQACLSKMFV
ncbi:TPA: restriction endonuclease subunit S [Serratia marcescens]|nr:restriction endonuclease subunit S [Serratia marcescens]